MALVVGKAMPGPADVPHPRQFVVPSKEVSSKWQEEDNIPFLELFDRNVKATPTKTALSWLDDNAKQTQSFTYQELNVKSRAIASSLLTTWKVSNGDPVVLVYPPGLEFLVTFIACLRAGVLAVPVYPPNPNDLGKEIPKMQKIVDDSEARVVLTTSSTMRIRQDSIFLSWLPQYHDLGLVVAYLCPLSAGATGIYLSPISFIKRPAMWAQLMSQHQVTHTAAPNFALELLCRKFEAARDAPAGLDLSSVECLLNCAEPVRPESIAKWNSTFGPYGFTPCAMCPAYGLAEHVVGVLSWGSKVVEVNEGSQKQLLHSSGQIPIYPHDGRLAIVDPETLAPCGDAREGEIWVRSQSVAQGYWKKPDVTREVFGARMASNAPLADDGVYLRTGDLGFVLEGELFVTGRIKDLIIINGKNYYPQDIEKTVEEASEHVRPGCAAAFSLTAPASGDAPAQESVAVVAEFRTTSLTAADYATATAQIRRAVTSAHGVFPSLVAFIPPRTIPKTTSGKIRRKEACKKLKQGAFRILNRAVYVADVPQMQAVSIPLQPPVEEPAPADRAPEEDEAGDDMDVNVESPALPESAETVGEEEGSAMAAAVVKEAVKDDKEAMEGEAMEEEEEGGEEEVVLDLTVVGEVALTSVSHEVEAEADSDALVSDAHLVAEVGVSVTSGGAVANGEEEEMMGSGMEVTDDTSLVDLGLTSMAGIDIIELVEKRTGHALDAEEVAVVTIGHLRAVDRGEPFPKLEFTKIEDIKPVDEALEGENGDVAKEEEGDGSEEFTPITDVKPSETPSETPSATESETFDAVVVCNGHYSQSKIASIPGIDSWPGEEMHSHNYRTPDAFTDKTVVVIGAAASGEDIAREIAQVAAEVHMCSRSWSSASAPPGPCNSRGNLWCHPMVVPFPLCELQSKWVAKVLSGAASLPSRDAMCRDVEAFYAQLEATGVAKRHTHLMDLQQYPYIDWLAQECGWPPMPQWCSKMYVAARENKRAYPEDYRDRWQEHALMEEAIAWLLSVRNSLMTAAQL
eukprot:jgi/Mesen1/3768/ME000205S03029